jgi:hypothetical protein
VHPANATAARTRLTRRTRTAWPRPLADK